MERADVLVMKPNKFNILVVDDNRADLDVLCGILQAEYQVSIAKSGPVALELAARDKPDIILMDIILPGKNGFEVLSALKESEETLAIPVICITSLDSIEDEEKGLTLGAVDYIMKPFHKSIVKARINTHLRIAEQMRMIERLHAFDTLTELPNKRSFDKQMKMEWVRAAREHTPISMLVIDADRFKTINDKYGHQRGDEVLKELAVTIKSAIKRPADYFARWGGEEFTALLPNTELDGAMALAEEIRAKVEAESSVTVSIGVATVMPSAENSIDSLFSQADKAMYYAKQSGRNQVQASVQQ